MRSMIIEIALLIWNSFHNEVLDKYSITPFFPISKTVNYDKYEGRFELGDRIQYNGKTWRIISISYQPKKLGLVNIDDENEKIEVNVNDVKIEDLELEKAIL